MSLPNPKENPLNPSLNPVETKNLKSTFASDLFQEIEADEEQSVKNINAAEHERINDLSSIIAKYLFAEEFRGELKNMFKRNGTLEIDNLFFKNILAKMQKADDGNYSNRVISQIVAFASNTKNFHGDEVLFNGMIGIFEDTGFLVEAERDYYGNKSKFTVSRKSQ